MGLLTEGPDAYLHPPIFVRLAILRSYFFIVIESRQQNSRLMHSIKFAMNALPGIVRKYRAGIATHFVQSTLEPGRSQKGCLADQQMMGGTLTLQGAVNKKQIRHPTQAVAASSIRGCRQLSDRRASRKADSRLSNSCRPSSRTYMRSKNTAMRSLFWSVKASFSNLMPGQR